MDVTHFKNLHAGETALLVGNGENLQLTPPECFDYPSFGLNTCHLWTGKWKPTYWTAVDKRVQMEFGRHILEKFRDVPKFIPAPLMNDWQGDNFCRFYHRHGSLWDENRGGLWPSGLLTGGSLAYANIMHVAMQLAFYMGFTTILMIGVQHKPDTAQMHFWGRDKRASARPPLDTWLEGYRILAEGMKEQGVTVLNISEDTYVPDDILPRGDWREAMKRSNTQCQPISS